MKQNICIFLVTALISLIVIVPQTAQAIAPEGFYTGLINFRRATAVGTGLCPSADAIFDQISVSLSSVTKTTGRKFDAIFQTNPVSGKQITRVNREGRSIKVYRFISIQHSNGYQFKYYLTLRNVRADKATFVYRGVTTLEGTSNGCAYSYGGPVEHVV